jgi:DNA polymerase-3 subunit epsilon
MSPGLEPEVTLEKSRFAALDFESAGYRPGASDEPVQIGIAIMQNWNLEETSALRSYLRVRGEVTWAAAQVHGISRKDLSGAPSIQDLWPEIHSRLEGAVVVAHGAGTEKRFLRIFPTHGFGPWIDTLGLARRCYPDWESHRLGDLVSRLSLDKQIEQYCPGLKWHDAYFDAVASLVLLRRLVADASLEEMKLRDFLKSLQAPG